MSKERIVFQALSGKTTPTSPFARFLATVAGAGVFVLALLIGGALFLVVLALALALGAVVAIRAWWWRRQNAELFRSTTSTRQSDADILDVEYTEVADRKDQQ
ncbi:MAG: hypothetical protein AAFN07_04250 [Pseudomonadota bacterium]